MRRRDLMGLGLGLGLASSRLFCAPPVAWDLSCDVAVAGGGGAGLSAALSAAQNGASVMLFEKMPRIGGDTLISGGYFNAVDPARQKPQGIRDSEALFAAQILKAGAGGNSCRRCRKSWEAVFRAPTSRCCLAGRATFARSPPRLKTTASLSELRCLYCALCSIGNGIA